MEGWAIAVTVVLSILIILDLLLILRWYIIRPMYHGRARIDGKIVVITGGNTGIGKETARDLYKRGAKVIILCRNTEKGKAAAREICGENSDLPIEVHPLDLGDLESVRGCAERLKEQEPKIDILINNAGIFGTKESQTKDGFELQFGTNHLGHFLLTYLLLDNLKSAAPSRIINVSSLGHTSAKMNWDNLQLKNEYNPTTAYTQSKLANILFTKGLAERLQGTGVTSYALHPGVVDTEIFRHMKNTFGSCIYSCVKTMAKYYVKTPLQGAQTTIYCAVDEAIATESGMYYSGCKKKTPSKRARNPQDAERLWNISMELVGLSA